MLCLFSMKHCEKPLTGWDTSETSSRVVHVHHDKRLLDVLREDLCIQPRAL